LQKTSQGEPSSVLDSDTIHRCFIKTILRVTTSQDDPVPDAIAPTLTTTPEAPKNLEIRAPVRSHGSAVALPTENLEGCDVHERVEGLRWFYLAAGFAFTGGMFFFVYPARYVQGVKFAISGVFWALSLWLLLLPCKFTIKFHRRTRRVEHIRRRLIWCVPSSTSMMNLDEVHGVEALPTGRIEEWREVYRIVLLTSHGELLLFETKHFAARKAEGWRRYHPCPTL
jgi:hypothetical protein